MNDEQYKSYLRGLESFDIDDTSVGARTTLRSGTALFPRGEDLSWDLPKLTTSEGDGEADLQIRHRLGIGGMGEVLLAQQNALARDVAVKTLLKKRARDEAWKGHLMQEARITGRLEHPNIVPVHALGLDADGAPLMVMKRIEGVNWQDALETPGLLPERYSTMPPLEAHLKILMEVCDAVHFAHSHGVIHRDLKPENVMIGAFGEVYVVDWGLAVSTMDDALIPSARDISSVDGSPMYMAPEMAAGKGEQLGIASDVFCLGAILHQIVTGNPRYTGSNCFQILLRAFKCEPFDYDLEQIPQRLVEVCVGAMAPKPEDRLASAETLRRALEEALRLEESSRLTLLAFERLDGLRSNSIESVYEVYGACHFGFKQALEIWPQSKRAHEGINSLTARMVEVQIERDDYASARQFFDRLETPTPSLEAKLAALGKKIEEERAELSSLKHLRRQSSLSVFSRPRAMLALLLGLAWSLDGFRRGMEVPTYTSWILEQVAMIVITTAIMVMARKWVWATQTNRKLVAGLLTIVTMDLGLRVLGLHLDLEVLETAVVESFLDFFGLVFVALLVDRRLLPATAIFMGGAIMSAIDPTMHFFFAAWVHLLAFLSIAFIWMRRDASSRAGEPPQG